MKKNESKTSKSAARPAMDRTTVSMAAELLKAGQDKAKKVRPYTFSDYVASLIEADVKASSAKA